MSKFSTKRRELVAMLTKAGFAQKGRGKHAKYISEDGIEIVVLGSSAQADPQLCVDVGNAMRRNVARIYGRHAGVKGEQRLNILAAVAERDGRKARWYADKLGISRGTLPGALEALKAKSLVMASASPAGKIWSLGRYIESLDGHLVYHEGLPSGLGKMTALSVAEASALLHVDNIALVNSEMTAAEAFDAGGRCYDEGHPRAVVDEVASIVKSSLTASWKAGWHHREREARAENEAHGLGQVAAREGISDLSNPNMPDTVAWQRWHLGWKSMGYPMSAEVPQLPEEVPLVVPPQGVETDFALKAYSLDAPMPEVESSPRATMTPQGDDTRTTIESMLKGMTDKLDALNKDFQEARRMADEIEVERDEMLRKVTAATEAYGTLIDLLKG